MTTTDQTTIDQTTTDQTASHQRRGTGSPTWIDLSTPDAGGAKAFYGALFGWTFEDLGEQFGHYHYILRDGAPVGGLMSTDGMTCPEGGELPIEWGVYLSVPDVESALRAASDAGGRVVVPAMPVGDAGTMAVILDPAGAAIGLWQPGDFVGFTTTTGAGTPVWFESMSQSIDDVIPFYREVFEWEIHEMEGDWRYVTNAAVASATAGLGDARGVVAEGVPSYWRIYLASADLDGDLQRIAPLGGTVLDGPVDSPWGRMATTADPDGASFQLIEPPPV